VHVTEDEFIYVLEDNNPSAAADKMPECRYSAFPVGTALAMPPI
jgi:hypothetical protein